MDAVNASECLKRFPLQNSHTGSIRQLQVHKYTHRYTGTHVQLQVHTQEAQGRYSSRYGRAPNSFEDPLAEAK